MAPSRRRFLLKLFAGSFALGVAAAGQSAGPPASGSGGSANFDLQKQLETGLKARRDADFRYIADIVSKVEAGTLPRRLVDQAFLYARRRDRDYPLIYFQFSLKELAKKAGVTL